MNKRKIGRSGEGLLMGGKWAESDSGRENLETLNPVRAGGEAGFVIQNFLLTLNPRHGIIPATTK